MALNSIITKVGDGVAIRFSVSFTGGYMDPSHIRCRVGDEAASDGTPIYRTPLKFITEGLIEVPGAPAANGVVLRFERVTPMQAPVNDFRSGTVLDEHSLDDGFKQVVFGIQELQDSLGNALESQQWAAQAQSFAASADASKQASATSALAAAAHKAAAQAAADRAANAAATVGPRVTTFAELKSRLVYASPSTGQIAVQSGEYVTNISTGAVYAVVASGAANHLDYTSTGGVRLRVQPGPSGRYSALAFGNTVRAGLLAAFAGGVRHLSIPACDEQWAVGIELPEGADIKGLGQASKITSSGTNQTLLRANNRKFVRVTDVFLAGNLTGLGSTSATATGGHGIILVNCTQPEVSRVTFDNFGNTVANKYASCVYTNGGTYPKIVDCIFLQGNGGGVKNQGADIAMAYHTKSGCIRGNMSWSEQDTFFSGPAVGNVDFGVWDIEGNYAERSDTSVTRSAVTLPYGAKTARGNIRGNRFVNFPANGVYISAGNGNDKDSAGLNVSDNVILWCGGSSAMLNISAGIYLSGRNGLTCTGNLVHGTGYKRDGTARMYPVAGIFFNGAMRGGACTGNHVSGSTGAGVMLKNVSGSTDMSDITITANVLFDNKRAAFEIQNSLASATMSRIIFSSNVCTQATNDAPGVLYNGDSGAKPIEGLTITMNQFVAKDSSTQYAFTCNLAGFTSAAISGNLFRGFYRGIHFANGGIADKEIGKAIVIDGNTFADISSWCIGAAIGSNKYALHFNSTFVNCGSEGSDAGRILAAARAGSGTFEFRRSAMPTDGTWAVGDRVLFTSPSSHLGAVCTGAGAPGVWRTHSALT